MLTSVPNRGGSSSSAARSADRRFFSCVATTPGWQASVATGLCRRPAQYSVVQCSRSACSAARRTTPYLISCTGWAGLGGLGACTSGPAGRASRRAVQE